MDHVWARTGPTKPGLHPRIELGVECRAARRADFAHRLRSRLHFFNALYITLHLSLRLFRFFRHLKNCVDARCFDFFQETAARVLTNIDKNCTTTLDSLYFCVADASKFCCGFDALRPSKSEKITGFYDVLIGCLVQQRDAQDIPILNNICFDCM